MISKPQQNTDISKKNSNDHHQLPTFDDHQPQTEQLQITNNQDQYDKKSLFEALRIPLFATILACIVLYIMNDDQLKNKITNIGKVNKFSSKNLEKYKNQELLNLLAVSKYYDLNSFDSTINKKHLPKVLLTGTTLTSQKKRQLITFEHNFEQIEQIISIMKYPPSRPQKLQIDGDFLFKNAERVDLSFFYNQLSNQPYNKIYLQAQYYHYNKRYDIGLYQKQLPLCIAIVGRNNLNSIKRTYDSILRQNYSNYHIVHVDDNSKDGTPKKIQSYLQKYPELKQKVTLLTQQSRKNVLYNRNYGVTNYCQENDIVVDIDGDDWLIGNQVFQLINSLYQRGIFYRGQREQLWAAYMSHIRCCPSVSVFGEVSNTDIEKQTYRSEALWRTSSLRTYLWKIYRKVEIKDFIDPLRDNGQFFVQKYDAFIHSAILQMSAPKHFRTIDEFPYYQNSEQNKQGLTQTYYSTAVAKNIRPYKALQNMASPPIRNGAFKINQTIARQLKQRKSQMKLKNDALLLKIQELIHKSNQSHPKIQQHTVLHKQYKNKQFGISNQIGLDNKKYVQTKIKENFDYEAHDIKSNIQVGSEYDYKNLDSQINYNKLEDKLFRQLAHEILTFNHNKNIQVQPGKIQFKQFKTDTQIQQYIKGLIIIDPHGNNVKDFQYYLGSRLAMPTIDSLTQQLQYYYANKKYGIGSNRIQQPICVLSSGKNLVSKGKSRNLLHSLQKMNYTNYKLIWVDDNSQDNSAFQVYQFLKQSNMRLKNRIKIIKNNQNIGTLGNIHIYGKYYCKQNNIVVVVQGEDNLIGTQNFQILNSIYQNSAYLYVFSRYLIRSNTLDQFYIGNVTENTNMTVKQVRTNQNGWKLSPMRTFRKKLLDSLPLSHFVEYKQANEKGKYYPHYYASSQNNCFTYSSLEASGDAKIHYLSDFMYSDQSQKKRRAGNNITLYNNPMFQNFLIIFSLNKFLSVTQFS